MVCVRCVCVCVCGVCQMCPLETTSQPLLFPLAAVYFYARVWIRWRNSGVCHKCSRHWHQLYVLLLRSERWCSSRESVSDCCFDVVWLSTSHSMISVFISFFPQFLSLVCGGHGDRFRTGHYQSTTADLKTPMPLLVAVQFLPMAA